MNEKKNDPHVLWILVCVLAVCTCGSEEQGPETMWGQIIGGSGFDSGQAVVETADSGFIVVGYTDSFVAEQARVYLIRLDKDGDTVWTDTHGSSPVQAFDITETTDGNYVITGYVQTVAGGNVFCMKIDVDGSVLWENNYGGANSDIGLAIESTLDGGALITGWTVNDTTDDKDVYLIKIDGGGDTLWTRQYGGPADDFGTALCRVSSSGFLVTGWTRSYGAGSDDVYLLRIDENGDTMWTRTHGDQNQDYGEGVIQIHSGNFIVTGVTQARDEAMSRIFLFEVDENGDSVWLQTYDDGFSYDVAQTVDNGFVLTGSHFYAFPDRNVYLLRTDATGLLMWEKSFGDDANDGGYKVIQTKDRGFLFVGETASFGAGSRDVYVMKIAPEGE